MRTEGIDILTLARDTDPEKYRKLWRMSDEAEQDVPTTVPHTGTTWEVFEAWMRSPGLRPERQWIAREGDDIVGISVLAYPPTRGNVWTDWTGTARKVRGRGVARALKCETVMQAIVLGVDRVRTDNDGENAPILHLNASMGYTRLADMIQVMKPA
jgi:RimJ/RimL family protein N-acetyltransferase